MFPFDHVCPIVIFCSIALYVSRVALFYSVTNSLIYCSFHSFTLCLSSKTSAARRKRLNFMKTLVYGRRSLVKSDGWNYEPNNWI